jgi:multiple sugar transport system substrate-binding protein
MSKFIKYLVIVLIIIGLGWYIYSLVQNAENRTNRKVISLWTAPTDFQLAFWSKAAEKWNKMGKGPKIVVNSIPAADSSEAAILNSIASRTSPDICENIFDGFSAQLAQIGAIHNMKDFEGFDELVKERKMESVMKRIQYKGENYMFPDLFLTTQYGWNWEILQKLGWTDVPRTYSDVYKLGKQFCDSKLKYALQVSPGRNWWNRWNDFISLYYGASKGQPYIDIENNKASFNDKYGKEALTFYKTLFDNGWAPNNTSNTMYFYEGKVVGMLCMPYDIDFMKNNFPDFLKKIKIGPIVVPDGMENKGYSLMDAKGMVIFKDSPHAKESWDFLRWVFSSDEMTILWMKLSRHPASRGDLLTNPKFKEFFDENPLLKQIAGFIPYGRPSAPITKTADVQQIMTDDLTNAMIYNTTTVDKALKNASEKIDKVLAKED